MWWTYLSGIGFDVHTLIHSFPLKLLNETILKVVNSLISKMMVKILSRTRGDGTYVPQIFYSKVNISSSLRGMRAPQRVLYVCLTATKIGVPARHGFCHTGFFTLLSSFWAIFVLMCAPFSPI
jgi:hypothetical protein